jgi:HEAT repeat protein
MDQKELNRLVKASTSDEKIDIIRHFSDKKESGNLFSLLCLLEDQNRGVRETIKEEAIKNPTKEFVLETIKFLRSNNPESRNLAAEILYSIVDLDIDCIGNLIINEKDENIKIFGCQILGYSMNPAAITFLKLALNDTNVNVRNVAANSLELSKLEFDTDFLLDRLDVENEEWVRYSIFEVLKRKSRKCNIDRLKKLVVTEPVYIAEEILKNCKIYGDLSSIDILINIKNESTDNILLDLIDNAILSVINNNPDYKTISKNELLTSNLQKTGQSSPDTWNRYIALGILSEMPERDFLSYFKEMVTDKEALIRIAALKAVSRYKGREIIEIIRSGIEDIDEEVRKTAESLLEKI